MKVYYYEKCHPLLIVIDGFGKLCRPPLEYGENEYSRKTLDAYVRSEPLLFRHLTASYCNFSDLTSSFQFSVTKVKDKGFKK